MTKSLLMALGTLSISVLRGADGPQPRLDDGVISYVDEGGQRRAIAIGERAADLWVSPDGTLIAFIGVAKQPSAASGVTAEPLIEESHIYTARKVDQFAPRRVPLQAIPINGRSWRVFRDPKVAPDRKSVIFAIPYTSTTSRVFRASLNTGDYTPISDATDFCVVWGGSGAGDLLMQDRYIPADPSTGVVYQCFLKSGSAPRTHVSDQCENFELFAAEWSRAQGAACH
jgi:hypothetical protein